MLAGAELRSPVDPIWERDYDCRDSGTQSRMRFFISGAGYKREIAEVRADDGNKSAGVDEFYIKKRPVREVIKMLENDGGKRCRALLFLSICSIPG